MNRERPPSLHRTGTPWPLLALAVAIFVGFGNPARSQDAVAAEIPLAAGTASAVRREVLSVTTTRDGGRGSLREAIEQANSRAGPDTIRFDATTGPFRRPRTITLKRPLPELAGELMIDGYIEGALWEASGVTLSGKDRHRVFSVQPDAQVTLASLTIARGHAQAGGGVANRGTLVVKGVTFLGNVADTDGGGLANQGGQLTVINSTFVDNRAGGAGGGIAGRGGELAVTNSSFSGNAATRGGGLFSDGALLLRNSILANSGAGADCAAEGVLDPASTRNLIEAGTGCGEPVVNADPRFEPLGSYNGPTLTLPLGGASPAINLGDNASAVDENGEPLVWDQRGNGDPRFVAGFTDLGAFEVQAFPVLEVNTAEDSELRACTGVGAGDCPLRGAIELANAMRKPAVITFDPRVFAAARTLVPARPLPEVTGDLTLDGGAQAVVLRGQFAVLRTAPDAKLTLKNVALEPAD